MKDTGLNALAQQLIKLFSLLVNLFISHLKSL